MNDPTPEQLLARDPCTLKAGLLGKRGQLSLYNDRVIFSTTGGSRMNAIRRAIRRLS